MKLKRKIDWTRKDADIARELGICRWRVGQLRVEETGISTRGIRHDLPKKFKPGKSLDETMERYGVAQHIAKWWHKCAGVVTPGRGRPAATIPQDFTPVLWPNPPINYKATARKYGVSNYFAKVWSDQYQAAAKP